MIPLFCLEEEKNEKKLNEINSKIVNIHIKNNSKLTWHLLWCRNSCITLGGTISKTFSSKRKRNCICF